MRLFLIIPAYGWLLLSSFFFTIGEFLSKRWGMNPTVNTAMTIAVIDVIATMLWLPALLHKNSLAVVGTAWLILGLVGTVSMGVIFFDETLAATQWIGIALAFGAIMLLSVGSA